MATEIQTWLSFAIQQMAAESYIHRALSGELSLSDVLKLGNNNVLGASPDDADLAGKTRFVDLANVTNASQITGSTQAFVSRYQIIDHHANDSTGFSATILKDNQTGEYTLSFRSTEFRDEILGGDYDRDAVKADGDIVVHGFAFAQLLAMEEYFARLKQGIKSDGMFDVGLHTFFENPTHQLNVTGYSLGGHLATVFTELHESEVRQTYLFNASGRGLLPGGVPGLAAEEQRIADMLAYFRRVLDNPDEALASIGRGQNYQDAVTAWANDPTWDPFDQGTATLYDDPRYQWARAATLDAFDPIGTSTIEIATGFQGEPQTTGAFAKMTALYGQAVSGDLEVVANSGVHRAGQAVLIEGQPLLANALGILPFGGQVDFGNTHAITLLVDSLSLQELFLTLDPQLQRTQIEALIRSSSNANSDLVALTTASHAAEGDSLEKVLEGLRKLFLPSPLTPATLNFDDAPGGFGNLMNRNDFYAAMAAVKTALAGATVTIESFVELNAQGNAVIRLAPSEVNAAALENTDRSLAFRYALKALNPFAVVGADYQGLGHASNGALTLFDPATGFGELTDQYLIDRAVFLEEKIEVNLLNDAKSSGNIHFKDFAPNGLEITTEMDLRVDEEFLFGSDRDEGIGVLVGRSKADHLYGGGGSDLLEGGDGRDYLQGDAGIDRLDGGEEADTMTGGADDDFYIVDNLGDELIEGFNNGTDRVESSVSVTLGANIEHLTLTGTSDINGTGNELDNLLTGNDGINRLEGKGGTDHLIGGDKNDILLGGAGDNDRLEGGAGFDTYIYNAGDGTDRIEDSDAMGQIIFQGHRLLGGIHDPNDPLNTYTSLDGLTTYVLSGTDLIVNGVLIVNADFQSGQFGIQLDDLSDLPSNTGVPTGPFRIVYTGTIENDVLGDSDGLPQTGNAVFGFQGNDYLFGAFLGNDLLDGGAGDDFLFGYSGDDYLDGGTGNDYLDASDSRNDVLIYDGHDILIGGAGDDVLYAGGFIEGIGEADYLDGGDGADYLWGWRGTDVLLGGEGDDILRGDNRPSGWPIAVNIDGFLTLVPGQSIFTATGGGDDFLDGGAGNDILVGDGGDDILSGGADNDQLFGDDFADDQAGYLVVPGDDILDGGAGEDSLSAGDGEDSLSGGAGLDQLFGDKGDDVLDGGDDADTMLGGDGADELFGGGGNDLLFGDGLNNEFVAGTVDGADFLDGGDGDDELQGGGGADQLSGGAGNDFLLGQDDDDTLFGDEGADELQGGLGNDLLGGDAGDDLLSGDAGDDTLFGAEGNDAMAGNDGDDSLFGGVGNDILEGGKGSDVLVGGAGNDIYNFSLGDGLDTITDTALVGEGNFINFFSGITLESLTFLQDQVQQTLTIQVAGGDSLRLLGFDPNTFSYVVDTLAFADGTLVALADQLPLPEGLIEGTDDSNSIRTGSTDDTIFAGAGNDTVNAGSGNDTLIGGSGNDVLTGGAGQDTYVFNSGDGMDIVSDSPGEGNRLVFGPGISVSSVTLGLGAADSLSVRTGVAGDAIQVLDNLEGASEPFIDALKFADGTTLSIEELLARGIEITGTAGPDTLTGTNLIDRISGGAGDDVIICGLGADIVHGDEGSDQIFGGDGDDLLDGGTGTDVLNGEAGEDTYVFGRGYGQDILSDSPVEQTGPNTIELTSGISPDEVRLQARQSENGNNVVLTINGTEDELTLLGAADSSLLPISQILFADGTSWETAEILTRIEGLRLTAAPADSSLEGTGFRDNLIGAQGNDHLDGRGGADRMVGGAGDDLYWVENPGDTVVELDGEGTDTVLSQIDYTLPEHVENLFLRSADFSAMDPIRGEGNASDNVLLGNLMNNVLIGGGGNDRFQGGPGDDDLSGGTASDTYVMEGAFNGFDTIHDVALPGEGNRLQFGTSVHPGDVVFVQDGSSLRITNSGGADGAVLENFDPSGMTGSLVTEVVAFSSGVEDVTGGYETHLLALMNPTLGTDNAEMMIGTSNAEVIKSQGGADVIVGGVGNDVLLGGTGSDTYVLNQGDGFDLIDDQPETGDVNRVQFGAGITQDMLRVSYNGTFGIGGLSVRIGASGDGVHFLGVSAEDPTEPHAIDTFHFADGTQLTFAQLFEREILVQGTGRSDGEVFGTFADDRMNGFGGSESLSSGVGDDQLEGGAGNDFLQGGEGEDTYIFRLGDGFDRIEDDAEFIDDGQGGHLANNRILFGPGIILSDLSFVEVDLTIRKILIGSNGDGIELPNFVDFSPGLRTISFSDGLTVDIYDLRDGGLVTDDQTIQGGPAGGVLIGGAGNDLIQSGGGNTALLGGAGNDTLVGGSGHNWISGGPGNDFLLGGSGGNTFLLSPGSGRDSIQIPNYQLLLDASTARFAGGYGSYHPGLTPGSLVIRYGDLGDELHILDFDPNDVFASPAIQRFEFSDRVLTYEELIALGFDIDGTGGDDVLTGTNTTDRFLGLSGHDDLSGGAGTDTFTGGQGNDTLRGGAGHDTYVFNIGDGLDTIEDVAAPGEGNRIQFGVGIVRADLTFTHDEVARTLTIQVGSSGADQLVLTNFDPTGANGSLVVETLAFADGSQANLAALLGGQVNHAPIMATPLADQTVPEDAPFSAVVPANTFADQDAGDVLALSASLADGTALPAWLIFDAATGTFSGVPDDAQVGSLDVKVTATDSGNLSVSDDFTLTVQNVNEAPTVAAPLTDQQAMEDAAFSFTVPAGTFADVDHVHGDSLTFNATLADGTALPTWLSFDPTTRTFGGTPLNGDVGTLTIDVTASDGGALSATDSFALTVQNVNDAPSVATLLLDQTAAEDSAFSFTVPTTTFADEDAPHGDVLTYGATLADSSPLPTWLSFNPTTRTFSGTPGAGNAGTLQILVTASDSGTLSATDTFALAISGPLPQTVIDTTGNDVLTGGRGDDTLSGLAGNDTLNGGQGHDLLDGGTGSDTMQGGTGNDTYVVENFFDGVTEGANEGTDTVQSSLLAYTLGANVENLTLTGTGPSAGVGNALSNQLIGNSGANLLDGKAGADQMAGGAGDDLYLVDHAGDTVVELADEGTLDSVTSSVSYSLSANVENLVLIGAAAINGTGNDGDNVLTGNGGANVLTGLAGNDTYVIGTGDQVVEAAGGGTDTVVSGLTHTLAANVENLTLVGFSAINGTGNTLDNVLNGLFSLAGNTLTGGAGNDTYIIDAGDTVVEAAGGGTDTVQSILTHTLGANVENLTLTGIGAINGTGNNLGNTMVGNSANNTLTGANGNDSLRGGLGNDTVNGASGDDTFLFGRGEGQDLVQDTGGTADKILYDTAINPLDLVLTRQANDLRLTIHGSTDYVTVQNWYSSSSNRTETIQAGNGKILLSTQVDQLILSMAGFTQQNNGLTWDQAIDQRSTQVESILAASWQ